MKPPEGMELPEGAELPEGMEPPSGFGGAGGMGFGGFGDSGASLKYSDDELSSYSDIFDNAETKVDEADEQRVVTALKQLSEGNVEASLDTDEVINYFVAHNFVMNYDSYTGSMLHNYYLYEHDGKLSMIPWDYNLAFGGFGGFGGGGGPADNWGKNGPFGGRGGDSADSSASSPAAAPDEGKSSASAEASAAGVSDAAPGSSSSSSAASASNTSTDAAAPDSESSDATSLVNCGIDTPLSGAEESERPMWAWITSSNEYLERYHKAYDKLLTSYFESGECKAEIERVRAMIEPYVQNDKSAFYTAEEFETAVDTLESFIEARTKSIRAQLDGTLSTKTDEQDKSAQVDASGINISAMGTQSRGR